MTTYKGKSSKQKIAELRAKVKVLQIKLEQKRGLVTLTRHGTYKAKREATEVKQKAREAYKWLESSVSHLVKDDSWNRGTSKQVHLEIMIRAIIAYRKLESGGVVAFSELAFLVTGSQFEYFALKDVLARTGPMWFAKRDLKSCIEAGYLKKIERKPLYYITLDGRARLDAILAHIYREKGLGIKVFKNKE